MAVATEEQVRIRQNRLSAGAFSTGFLPENRVRFPRAVYHVIKKKVYIIVLFPGLLEDE